MLVVIGLLFIKKKMTARLQLAVFFFHHHYYPRPISLITQVTFKK